MALFLYVTETTANLFVVGPFTETANSNNCASRAGIPRPHSSSRVGPCGGRADVGVQATCELPSRASPRCHALDVANDERVGELYELFMGYFANRVG